MVKVCIIDMRERRARDIWKSLEQREKNRENSRLTMASSLDMPRARREGDQERIADKTRWPETRTE